MFTSGTTPKLHGNCHVLRSTAMQALQSDRSIVCVISETFVNLKEFLGI